MDHILFGEIVTILILLNFNNSFFFSTKKRNIFKVHSLSLRTQECYYHYHQLLYHYAITIYAYISCVIAFLYIVTNGAPGSVAVAKWALNYLLVTRLQEARPCFLLLSVCLFVTLGKGRNVQNNVQQERAQYKREYRLQTQGLFESQFETQKFFEENFLFQIFFFCNFDCFSIFFCSFVVWATTQQGWTSKDFEGGNLIREFFLRESDINSGEKI